MARLTRRAFLQTSAGTATGAVAAGAVGLASGGVIAAIAGESAGVAAPPDSHLVAYVRNGSRGEVTLMVGDREITYRDPALVNRMLRVIR